mmetsp:Transcript_39625/g.92621  ORF Transcript_39625/g.92621 Transcript_39625/m.92621 type:complete len:293 (-) Transcript_39625:51-929(-)
MAPRHPRETDRALGPGRVQPHCAPRLGAQPHFRPLRPAPLLVVQAAGHRRRPLGRALLRRAQLLCLAVRPASRLGAFLRAHDVSVLGRRRQAPSAARGNVLARPARLLRAAQRAAHFSVGSPPRAPPPARRHARRRARGARQPAAAAGTAGARPRDGAQARAHHASFRVWLRQSVVRTRVRQVTWRLWWCPRLDRPDSRLPPRPRPRSGDPLARREHSRVLFPAQPAHAPSGQALRREHDSRPRLRVGEPLQRRSQRRGRAAAPRLCSDEGTQCNQRGRSQHVQVPQQGGDK